MDPLRQEELVSKAAHRDECRYHQEVHQHYEPLTTGISTYQSTFTPMSRALHSSYSALNPYATQVPLAYSTGPQLGAAKLNDIFEPMQNNQKLHSNAHRGQDAPDRRNTNYRNYKNLWDEDPSDPGDDSDDEGSHNSWCTARGGWQLGSASEVAAPIGNSNSVEPHFDMKLKVQDIPKWDGNTDG